LGKQPIEKLNTLWAYCITELLLDYGCLVSNSSSTFKNGDSVSRHLIKDYPIVSGKAIQDTNAFPDEDTFKQSKATSKSFAVTFANESL
jgi:hypothetical protein